MSRTTSILRGVLFVVFFIPTAIAIFYIGVDDMLNGLQPAAWLDVRERWRKWVRENIVAEYPYAGRM